MFCRSGLVVEEAYYFSFLGSKEKAVDPDVCRMDRLPFGASCSPFVAIYFNRHIMKDASAAETEVSAFRNSIYVNDYLHSAPSVMEVVSETAIVRDLLFAADLKWQRWISNSPEFVRMMRGADVKPSHTSSAQSLVPDPEEKVLGVVWNTHSDILGFKIAINPMREFTRVVLVS